jgi:hypothetical protein
VHPGSGAAVTAWQRGAGTVSVMFVTNHVLAGGLIGMAAGRRPGVAFAAGVVSHLAMDAIPHHGCRPGTFMTVARRDGLTGLAVIGTVGAATRPPVLPVLAGMAGAALLDLDKPVRLVIGRSPWPRVVNQIHAGIQRESPDRLRQELVTGAALAAVLAGAVICRARRQRRDESAAR